MIESSYIQAIKWLATGQWFFPGTLVSSTNKTDRHDRTEILLKGAKKDHIPSPNYTWNLLAELFLTNNIKVSLDMQIIKK
jgi:hypothetical protein